MLSRRRFLGLAGGAAGGAVVAGATWRALVSQGVEQGVEQRDEPVPTTSGLHPNRVLVVVQLGGGNDALNTLVPVNDGRYHDARPTLAVPPDQVVPLAGAPDYALHHELAGLVPHWDKGRLAAVIGVAFPDQSRSHFRAMDTWWSAEPGAPRDTGWLGRWLDGTGDGTNPLRAVALGGGSPALLAEHSISTVVNDPAAFAIRAPAKADTKQLTDAFVATSSPYSSDPAIAAAQSAVPAALDAVDHLAATTAAESARESNASDATSPDYDGRGELAGLMDTAAGLIGQRIGTQVVVVAISGFDTHSAQATDHPRLLGDVNEALSSFFEKVDAQGQRDDVLVMTTTEFGRRVRENGGGTDHGNGGLQLLCGTAVNGRRVVGSYGLDQPDQGDVPVALDTRSVYAACLDWLGGPTDDVLGGTYDRLDLVRA